MKRVNFTIPNAYDYVTGVEIITFKRALSRGIYKLTFQLNLKKQQDYLFQ